MKTCKYCGIVIDHVELFDASTGRAADDIAWVGAGTRSVVCRKANWHAPHDVPESLERESVEAWLREPLVID